MSLPKPNQSGRLARERNQEYYDALHAGQQAYWRYMPAPLNRVKRIMALARASNPASVCDFGCGDGGLLERISAAIGRAYVCGVDLSEVQINQNRQRMPKVGWATADLADAAFIYPFDRQVELVIASEVIEHLDAPGCLLDNAYKALLPGGRLILTTQSGKIHETEKFVGHVRHWSAQELSQALRQAGFGQVQTWNEGFPFHDLSKHLANIRPAQTIKKFCHADYSLQQKAICLILRALFCFNSRRRGLQLYALARKPDDAPRPNPSATTSRP